jgi:hypothetical protein
MSTLDILILISVGVFAGFLNTVAGGGSLITLPVLIFMGLPSPIANASNRVAIFFQNIFSVQGFRSKGVFVYPFSIWVAISSMFGAILGAFLAVEISGVLFNRILAVIMVLVIIMTVFKPGKKKKLVEVFDAKRNTISIVLFFGVGVYGGFIQAGIGFIMIAILTGVHGLGMAKTNSIKVFTALCYTAVALVIFIWEDKIWWEYGLTLAIGNAIGGWIASRWSVGKDDRWIRLIMIVAVLSLAVKLWFF